MWLVPAEALMRALAVRRHKEGGMGLIPLVPLPGATLGVGVFLVLVASLYLRFRAGRAGQRPLGCLGARGAPPRRVAANPSHWFFLDYPPRCRAWGPA